MKRKLRLLFPVIASLFALSGCDFISIKGGKLKIDDPYYEGLDYSKTGTKLQQELQKFLFSKHVKFIAYKDVNSYFSKKADANSAEAVEDGSEYNQYFYTGKVAASRDQREHVWPCAKSDQLWEHKGKDFVGVHNVDYEYYVGAGSDLYHIRTCTGSVNQNRGSSRFVDFDDEEMKDKTGVAEVGDGGPYKLKIQGQGADGFADFSEPADEMKGDVARIVLYLYVHYGNKNLEFDGSVKSGQLTYKYNDFIGDLVLTNIMGYSTNKKCQDVLKEWNELDPPSAVEKLRNNTVQKVQGNRNPFVDYPEIANYIF